MFPGGADTNGIVLALNVWLGKLFTWDLLYSIVAVVIAIQVFRRLVAFVHHSESVMMAGGGGDAGMLVENGGDDSEGDGRGEGEGGADPGERAPTAEEAQAANDMFAADMAKFNADPLA